MDETHAEELRQGDGGPRKVGRAVFLGTVLGGVSALWWGKAGWDRVSAAISPLEKAIPLVPSGGWRIYTISGSMPRFDPKTWRLSLGGLVDQESSLTYEELRSLPKVHQVSTFHCVTGWTVKNVSWGGVRLDEVLKQASPKPEAHALQFVSMEVPYVDYLTVQQAGLHDVMLAYEMDGKPLPREHGAPVRLVIPEMYGYKKGKWLKGNNVVGQAKDGYWEQLGYDRDAWVGRSNGYGE